MARIRTIKPEFWTSEQIVDCSPTARLLFIGMWNFSDDNGVHPASCKRLKMEVFPADRFEESDVEAMVAELMAAGLIEHYTKDGAGYWAVTGWSKHQKIDRPTFKHPAPDRAVNSPNSTTTRRDLAETSTTPHPRNGMEGKGKEEDSHASSGKPAEALSAGKPSASKGKSGETLATFLECCKAEGAKPIAADDPVFAYAQKVGLTEQMVALAWVAFKAAFLAGSKRQKDWRAHFRNAVRGNWYHLWYISPEEGSVAMLTTAGHQAMRAANADQQQEAA